MQKLNSIMSLYSCGFKVNSCYLTQSKKWELNPEAEGKKVLFLTELSTTVCL